MKVKDAIKLLQNCEQENELVVEDRNSVGIGVLPFFRIHSRSFVDGFDWDKGKTFIRLIENKDTQPFH